MINYVIIVFQFSLFVIIKIKNMCSTWIMHRKMNYMLQNQDSSFLFYVKKYIAFKIYLGALATQR